MMQLMKADGIYLGYYHPEYVDLDKLRKYRVEGEKGIFVAAADVKAAIGAERWNVLASNETSYLFEEHLVVNSPEKYNAKPRTPFDHPQHAGIWRITVIKSCRTSMVKYYEDRGQYEKSLRMYRRRYDDAYLVSGCHRIGREWVKDTITT